MGTGPVSVTLAVVPGPVHLRVADLRVQHGNRVALAEVSLDIAGGTAVAVIGANGSGKSTLLRAIAGLQKPAAGTIDTGGADVAMVLQTTTVEASLPITVLETVRMARAAVLGPWRRTRAEDREAVADAMARLEVTDLADRPLHELSGGQRQRVLVAQGLAQGAPILLLDEPVTGLDLVSRDVILGVIAEEALAGRVVCTSTHDLDEARRCDHVVLLATRLVAQGDPDEVLSEAHLREAFHGRVLRLPDGQLLVDDAHLHHHGSPW
jgi:ABC-type Mn2+/Zn2+ transport system ATPase subunit